MPYATNDDIPADVKRRFKGHCQTVWRQAWNDTYQRHNDEGRAFATAEIAGQQCEDSTKMTTAVKFVKGSSDLIEGLAIPFGGPFGGKDFDGEFFTKNTDLCLDWFPTDRPLLYHHGLHDTVKTAVVGRVKSHDLRDDGIWVQAELDKNSRYRAAVDKLVSEGGVGFSSGTMQHLVETDTKTGEIKRWPWVEESLTPVPANPDALVYAVKSTDLIEHLAAIEIPIPSALVAAAMKSLDQPDDDALPDGVKFADHIDRLVVDGAARVKARKDWNQKSGRVLSAATRNRLAAHPEQLRQLAKDLDDLLATADGDTQKAALAVLAEFELQEARLNGVPA